MTRLLVHLEGQTEEAFVNEILRGHLLGKGYDDVSARIVGNARLRKRGGIRSWPSVRNDIIRHLKADPTCIATTMVDYYGLPQDGNGAWPGRNVASGLSSGQKASSVEACLLADIRASMGKHFNPKRFVPFVVMHEFEALLFSDCARFSRGVGRPELASKFQAIRDKFLSPEDINDSSATAPSKRIKQLVIGYQKPLFGVLAALEIGLGRIRQECAHFDGWLLQLESRALAKSVRPES